MKIHHAPPNTLEWLAARAGVVTASEFDQVVTPEFKARTGEMPRSYLARKVAEKWLGSPLAGYQSIDMEIGQVLEDRALPAYRLLTGNPVTRVGLVTTDDGTIGCSPDGLIGDFSGIEIKCPRPETHVKYLLNATLPKEYAPQVHGGMFVTGRKEWVFMSYARGFPPFIMTVERNDEIMEALGDALNDFATQLNEAYQRLIEINDGPPKRPTTFQPTPQPKPKQSNDVIP
jgi:hypothetical protein